MYVRVYVCMDAFQEQHVCSSILMANVHVTSYPATYKIYQDKAYTFNQWLAVLCLNIGG